MTDKRIGYWVRAIDSATPYHEGTILQVVSASCSDGVLLLGFADDDSMWRAEHFEQIAVYKTYDDAVVTYEAPDATIEVSKREYNMLLDMEMWVHAALLGGVRDFCGWSDIVEHYLQLKKESREYTDES